MVACTRVGGERRHYFLALGILHGDVAAPGAGTHRDLHGTLHRDSGLEVDPAVVVLAVAAFHYGHDVLVIEVGGETWRAVFSDKQTQFQVAVVDLVAAQQVAVQQFHADGGSLSLRQGLYGEVRRVTAALDGQRGSLAAVVDAHHVGSLVVVVAGARVGVEGADGLASGILHGDVAAPGTSAH